MSILIVIIPTTRGHAAFPSIRSALCQKGFDRVDVVVSGNSCSDPVFRMECENLSPRLHAVAPSVPALRLPGGARNDALDAAMARFPDASYVFFLDDDVQVPENYCETLKRLLDEQPAVAAVMGRLESSPANYWGRVIDHSNFWWLQVETNILDLGWLGAGCTMAQVAEVRGIRFDESVRVGEDVAFFRAVAARAGKTLAVCSKVTGHHVHGRCSAHGVVQFQIANGLRLAACHHPDGVDFRRGVRNIRGNLRAAWTANSRYLAARPLVAIGVAISFSLFELGIQLASHRLQRSRKRMAANGPQPDSHE